MFQYSQQQYSSWVNQTNCSRPCDWNQSFPIRHHLSGEVQYGNFDSEHSGFLLIRARPWLGQMSQNNILELVHPHGRGNLKTSKMLTHGRLHRHTLIHTYLTNIQTYTIMHTYTLWVVYIYIPQTYTFMQITWIWMQAMRRTWGPPQRAKLGRTVKQR